jgi:chemotaxis protein CheY-P-specific phosphatase CheC
MHIDVNSLGTFNDLAREGTEQATSSLSQMTGIDATVDITKIALMDRNDLSEAFSGRAFVGVEFGFEGGLAGQTVVVFEESCVDTLVDALMGGAASSLPESSVKELGNIMMGGFIDGWADFLHTSIEITTPTYREGSGTEILPDTPVPASEEQIFVFKSDIEWLGEDLHFYIYMLPEQDTFTDVMTEHGAEGDDVIPIDKLAVFNEMARTGTERAAQRVTTMTGVETEVDVSQISFAPIEDVPNQVDDKPYIGTVVEFEDEPSGFLLILFDENSARNIAAELMPMDDDGGDELTAMHRSAVEELGNIMTSGLIDGWANVLQTTVDHTPPRLVHDMGHSIVDPLAAQVGQRQEHAFVVESTMHTEDIEFSCEIHALPNERELRDALEALDVERADETEADPDRIF